jgi:hypothetical protein
MRGLFYVNGLEGDESYWSVFAVAGDTVVSSHDSNRQKSIDIYVTTASSEF